MKSEDIYAAAFDTDALGRLPGLLAEVCGGRSGMIAWFDSAGCQNVLDYSYFSAQMMKDYAETFATHDVWADLAFSKRYLNSVNVGNTNITDEQFQNSILFNEFFRKSGDDTFYCVGGAHVTRWGTALVGVHRNRRPGPFGEAEVKQLDQIIRQVRGALTLRGQLANERNAGQVNRAGWDAINLACIVVRNDELISQTNEAADQVLRRADCLRLIDNRVSAIPTDQNACLVRALRMATAREQPTGSSLRLENSTGVEYFVSITPLTGTFRPRGAGALIVFKDPLAPQSSLTKQLMWTWALTPHEALVAAAMAEGRSIAEIAELRGVSASTVKSQLKAISVKMGGQGQASLIAKIRMLV